MNQQMQHSRTRRALAALIVSVLPLSASAEPQAASADATQRPAMRRPAPDFFFGRPKGSVGVRGGWMLARADSEWYRFVSDQLTLERSDFNAPVVGVDVGAALTPRLDAVFTVEASQSGAPSEYRRLVDDNRLPISQETRLRQVTLSGGFRVALLPRGRAVSRLAWVPARVVPYVGSGLGVTRFSLDQTGDFVDFLDSSIFSDSLQARAWAPSAHVQAGVDVHLSRHLFLTLDGRYFMASGTLGRTWVNFDPLDLAGARISTGLQLTF